MKRFTLPTGRRPLMTGVTALFTALGLGLTGCSDGGSSEAKDGSDTKIVIAEPAHNLGYLPLYVAINKGIFADHGLEVSFLTQSTGGGAHVNAVLSGQAWGFIGGPEHNGFVLAEDDSGSVEIKAIANVVNRGNVYLVARKGVEAPSLKTMDDVSGFLAGKKIATGAYGGTPNSILRYLLAETGLTPDDITLTEVADPAAPVAILSQKQADYALIADPIIAQGVAEGVWGEPILSVPQLLGDYAYSTINVPIASYEGEGKATAQAFVDSIAEALRLVHEDRTVAEEVAAAEFPNLDPDVITQVLDRAYADGLWPQEALVSEAATDLSLAVARGAGALNDADDPAEYADVVDTQFLDQP
jgi:NitT/TauT family transport system substrate-binding protein